MDSQTIATFGTKIACSDVTKTLTRALLGLWISTACWGGGAFERPPMISAPGRRREKRKAAFESSRKIISKSFRSFFGSGQNCGLQGSKFQNFPKQFFDNKIFNLKIEQRIWYHCVCLVKARRTIYKMTMKGQGQSLTSGQVRPRSRDDPKWVILHITRFAWPRRTYWHQSHVSISFWSKVIGKWRLVTSGDLKWPLEG